MNTGQSLPEFAVAFASPTEDQLNAMQLLEAFFQGESSCFLLKGYAGTGKTWLLGILVAWLESRGSHYMLMAPTGRAARILARKTGKKATTIHKGIYNFDELEEVPIHINGKKKYKFRYNLNRVNMPGMVFIADEASMISDRVAESDFFVFGTGKLLTDLITFAAPQNLDNKVKIILTGDPAQLPPVGDSLSGALDESYLRQQFSLHPVVYELTQVVRQSAGNEILDLATSLREQLRSGTSTGFSVESFSRNVNVINPEEVVGHFLNLNPGLSVNETIIINFDNKSALGYNLALRNEKFPGKPVIQKGDNLMIVQNNYNYQVDLLNGTLVKVTDVAGDPEVKGNMFSFDQSGNECSVSHTFRRVTIEVEEDDRKVAVECLILEDFLYSPDAQPDYAQNIALYLDFKIRHPHLKPGTKPFTDSLKTDPWFNALRVKYGYAITCHKAQGGEWNTVFLNMDVALGKLTKPFLRWAYTAVTRARCRLFLFNYIREKQFSRLHYIPKLLPGATSPVGQKEIIIDHPENFDAWASAAGVTPQPRFIFDRIREIWAVARDFNLSLTRLKPETFCEVFRFDLESRSACLKFWFNSRNKFTSIQLFPQGTNDPSWGNQLKDLLSQPVNLFVKELDQEPMNLPDSTPEMLFGDDIPDKIRNLYHGLLPALTEKHISVDQITRQSYCEVYHFSRPPELAALQFYYNNRYQFTTAQPYLSECNSNQLLVDLEEIINDLKHNE
ncbi:MAG TPA: AAA family ATPase [Prolixibacteraceae bacterium]|jgi:hypothetical protein|nr:AAA family ATPase [Prolixibacteraceae bacterium]HOS91589.1 AAA family ATPase [Prolixibacteraceae bacterium]HQJ86830.1 AAA family ATPase [Prolixibacteraceae bacterium]